MASNLIPFEGTTLPAYLKQAQANLNDELTNGVGQGFPYLSIKGKTFTIIRGNERQVLMRPDDDETPANSIEVVILRANKNLSKIYYLEKYNEKESEGKKPDCFSNDGVAPDPSSEHPQAKKCAACPHNQWGARITEDGKKGKECQDARRVAVAAAGQLNDPMLLRIPPATLKPLAEYGDMLKKRGVPMQAVVTRIKFDVEAATPKLEFKPKGLLTEAQYNEAVEMAQSDLVQQIIASGIPLIVPEAASAEPAAEEPKPAKAKGKVTDADVAKVLDDDEPKKQTKAKVTPKKPAVVANDDDDLEANLAKILDEDD